MMAGNEDPRRFRQFGNCFFHCELGLFWPLISPVRPLNCKQVYLLIRRSLDQPLYGRTENGHFLLSIEVIERLKALFYTQIVLLGFLQVGSHHLGHQLFETDFGCPA